MSELKRLNLDLENKVSIEELNQKQDSEIIETAEKEFTIENINKNYIEDKEVERFLKIFDILVGEDKTKLKGVKTLIAKTIQLT